MDSSDRAVAGAGQVARVFSETPEQRIARASGIGANLATAIREAVPADGRLVLYSPYGGAEFELDADDPRGDPARLVRTLFERAKNLLYPNPIDVHFARDAVELLDKIDVDLAGRLVVLDGTQGPDRLTVGGDYELLHEEAIGAAGRLRLWRLSRAK